MSNEEKGKIMEQILNLPPELQTRVAGFVDGMIAANEKNTESKPKPEKSDKNG